LVWMHTGVRCHDNVVTCDVPFGGFVLFNNLTVHRRFLISLLYWLYDQLAHFMEYRCVAALLTVHWLSDFSLCKRLSTCD